MAGVKKRTRGGEHHALEAYLREISTFPSLTAEEERELGRRIRRHRDQRAFRRLVESNLRLVAGYAGSYRGLGVVLLDLIDEANVGLMEAARRFDPERNGKFTAWARWWIREAIMRALAEQGHVFVVPGGLTSPVRGARRAEPASTNLAAPGVADAAGFCGTDEADELLEDDAVRRAIIEHVGDALYELTSRERDVIRLRLGLDAVRPLTVEETADRLRLSPERAAQVEDRARRKLRRSQKARGLRTGLN